MPELFPLANDQLVQAPVFRHRSCKYHIRMGNRMGSFQVVLGSEEKASFEKNEDDGARHEGFGEDRIVQNFKYFGDMRWNADNEN